MNWLLLAVALIFLLGLIWGILRGFLRIGISLLSTLVTLVLVILLNPYVSAAVEKWTPLDEFIEEQCIAMFVPSISEETLEEAGLTQAEIQNIPPELLEELAGEVSRDTQIRLVEESPLPSFLKESLLENNNSEIYERLGVSTFPEYAASYIARLAINIATFVITFLLVWILLRAVIAVADLVASLPIIHSLNKIAGGLVGLLLALVVVWIGFLILTVACDSEMGTLCFRWIEENAILTFLYDKNPLLGFLLPI